MKKDDKIIEKREELARKIVIFKPRAVIHSSISRIPTKKELQIYNLALKKAKEKINYLSTIEKYQPIVKDWENGKFELLPSVSLSISELKNLFPHFKKRSNKHIYEIFRKMEEIKIERINILKKDSDKYITIEEANPNNIEISEEDFEYVDRVDIYRLISNVSLRFNDDTVTFYLPPAVIAYLANPNMYANINLLITNYLRSSYAINLYELLIDFFDNQKRKNSNKDYYETGKIQIDKLKNLFGISKNKYTKYADFKKRVLKPAIEELNQSDVVPFFVEFQEIKKGKKVEWINFIMEDKPDYLKSDVILTKKGPQKITYEEKKFQNPSDKYPVKKELLELKEKIKNGLPYIIFKKELMKIQDSYICNKINGYQPYLILKTNNIGHLEIYNPQIEEIRQLDKIKDAKELEELRQFLYKNPDRIGDIQEIDKKEIQLEELKKEFLNKYYHFVKDNMHYIIYIKNLKLKNDEYFILKGDDIVEGIENIKLVYPISQKEKIISFLKNEIKDDEIAYYQDLNRQEKERKIIEEFESKKDEKKLEEFINHLEQESLKLVDEWKVAKSEEEKDNLSKQISFLDSLAENLALYLAGEYETPNIKAIEKYLEYIKN